jgi:hypothetical protein
MARERFISDNPYRLLLTPSECSFVALRRTADAVSQEAKVGLTRAIPFAEVFGDDLTDIQSRVRSLGSDPIARSLYRILWPFESALAEALVSATTLRKNEVNQATFVQATFLLPWYQFLLTGSVEELADAIRSAAALKKGSVFTTYLASRLANEEDLSREIAAESSTKAIEQLLEYVSERSCKSTIEAWEQGQISLGEQLLLVWRDSPLPEAAKEGSLDPLGEFGERLAGAVNLLVEQLKDWRQGHSVEMPSEVFQLARFSDLLAQCHPSAADWAEVAKSWVTQLCWLMRQESLRLHNEGKNGQALAVIVQALGVSTDLEQRKKLADDRLALESLVEDDKQSTAYSGILPIRKAPSLHTINGFGTKLYGSEPFHGDRRLHFSILYFTALYIPVFPIARYLVEEVGKSRWSFYGRCRWTAGMKVHLAGALVAIIALGLGSTYSPQVTDKSSDGTWPSSPQSLTEVSQRPQSNIDLGPVKAYPKIDPVPEPSNSPAEAPENSVSKPTPEKVPEESEVTAVDGRQLVRQAKEDDLKRLKKEILALDKATKELANEIDVRKAKLSIAKQALDDIQAQIDLANVNKASEEEVDAYNDLISQYKVAQTDYNTEVDGFNLIVNAYNEKLLVERQVIRKHNELVKELNSSR